MQIWNELAQADREQRLARLCWLRSHQSLQAIYFGATLRLTLHSRVLAWPMLPGFRITGIRIEDRGLLVDVAYTPLPRPFMGK
jgi:hypothetical protein